MFFNDTSSLTRILVVGTLAYILIILILRIFGKRSLSKINAYDFIVTVALGSILGSILTSQDIALVDGILAFAVLIVMQFIFSWVSLRSQSFSYIIRSQPTLVYYDNAFQPQAMEEERVKKNEVLQAARTSGYPSLDEVYAVVLETDGTFSVIKYPDNQNNLENSTLQDVQNYSGPDSKNEKQK